MGSPAWVSAAGIVGTWIIAIAAIWGERIRAAFLRPDLRLELLSRVGELTIQEVTPTAIAEARYYHLRVTNRRRFPAAHEMQVLLTQLEIAGPDGQPQTIYTGALPLTWRFPELHPKARTIGHVTKADVDLLFVRPDILQLMPVLVPNNLPATMLGEAHLWITAIACGLDGESRPLRLRVDWDGGWDRGDTEMGRHLTISVV